MISLIQLRARLAGVSILLTLAAPISVHASNGFFARWFQRGQQLQSMTSPPGVPHEIQSLPAEMKLLPLGIQTWFVYETDYLSRAVDPTKIMSPTQNDQDPFYAPEAKNVFNLTGVWVSENELKVFENSELSPDLQRLFERRVDGHKEYLFLIHPESVDLYKNVFNHALDQETFRAVATASSRSLLVWKPGEESKPFIAKVSLNKTIGHVNRSIKGIETAMSVGISRTLNGSENLPQTALYMNEPLGLIPTGMDRGGMILRTFPAEFLDGKSQFLPLFALYGDRTPGILLKLIKNSKLSPSEYVQKNIVAPFVRLWTQLAVEQGILMEPHAQNMLIELKNGELTGRFVMRDFGGFNIDFEARKKLGLFVPESLPTFSGDVRKDYYLDAHNGNIQTSLYTYFEGGFLYNVQAALNRWSQKGLIKMSESGSYDFHQAFIDELSSIFSEEMGRPVQIGSQYQGLENAVLESRSIHLRNDIRFCRTIFK